VQGWDRFRWYGFGTGSGKGSSVQFLGRLILMVRLIGLIAWLILEELLAVNEN
jgi:hypothetical protein